MPDLTIGTLRGGMNNTEPAVALPQDQCVLAQNVEWIDSMLGERRHGSDAIDLTGAGVASRDQITLLHRHLPTSDDTAAELYALGLTSTTTLTLSRKTTSWGDVTISDTPTKTGVYPFQWQAVTIHGKTFFAYKSDVDRLHLVDGAAQTALRRAGLKAPTAAPTAANTGSGTLSGTRYYRVRFTIQSGGTTVLRSEPSAVLTHAPSGSGSAIRVTKPADTGENATHWELEASTGNVNFYVIATTAVGTTTYDDSTNYVTDYAANPLSEDLEDYALLPSARYLTTDEDRLIWGGSHDDESMQSRVGWTPVKNADGVGNDERMESDTDPTIDLDGYRGGPLTGLSSPVLGTIVGFKFQHIYKLLRTGEREKAYQALLLTDARGALHGSVVEGLDEQGRPCVYFLDPFVGPSVFGVGGIRSCGLDLFATWQTVNLDATQVICRGLYYPAKRQVHWWIATGDSNVPDTRIVLHTQHTRFADDGVRKGWAVWTGPASGALAACLFADNIDDGAARSKTLVPYVGLVGNGLVHRCDTGDDDNGTAFHARIVTKPITATSILDNTGITTGALVGEAVTDAAIDVSFSRDFGAETVTVSDVSFTPAGSETSVIARLDALTISECAVVQVEFADTDPASGERWALDQLVLRGTTEQRT